MIKHGSDCDSKHNSKQCVERTCLYAPSRLHKITICLLLPSWCLEEMEPICAWVPSCTANGWPFIYPSANPPLARLLARKYYSANRKKIICMIKDILVPGVLNLFHALAHLHKGWNATQSGSATRLWLNLNIFEEQDRCKQFWIMFVIWYFLL